MRSLLTASGVIACALCLTASAGAQARRTPPRSPMPPNATSVNAARIKVVSACFFRDGGFLIYKGAEIMRAYFPIVSPQVTLFAGTAGSSGCEELQLVDLLRLPGDRRRDGSARFYYSVAMQMRIRYHDWGVAGDTVSRRRLIDAFICFSAPHVTLIRPQSGGAPAFPPALPAWLTPAYVEALLRQTIPASQCPVDDTYMLKLYLREGVFI